MAATNLRGWSVNMRFFQDIWSQPASFQNTALCCIDTNLFCGILSKHRRALMVRIITTALQKEHPSILPIIFCTTYLAKVLRGSWSLSQGIQEQGTRNPGLNASQPSMQVFGLGEEFGVSWWEHLNFTYTHRVDVAIEKNPAPKVQGKCANH